MSENSDFWVGPSAAPETYELIGELGSGGEGQVWKGVVPLSDAGRRLVAIKILLGTGAQDEEYQWKRFGHLLMSLSHPGLVRVTEVFTGPRLHRKGTVPPRGVMRYVVMDFVEGDTLREWIADHPEAGVATRIQQLRTIASALDEMHSGHSTEVPVAHGDVKPENIIVRANGGAILVDLGLARLSDGTGVIGRTNPYAAPELHILGGQATPATDSFAFVATLAHVLTGQQPPLDQEGQLDLDELDRQLQANPITNHRQALVKHIHDALRASPEARPVHLANWLNAITATLSQLTGPAARTDAASTARINTPPPAPTLLAPAPPARLRRRRRGAIAFGIAALVALIALGGTYLAGYRVTNSSSASAPPVTATTTAAPVTVTSTRFATQTVPAAPISASSVAISGSDAAIPASTVTVTETSTTTESASPTPLSNAGTGATGIAPSLPGTLDLSTVDPVDSYGRQTGATPLNVNGKTYTSAITLVAYFVGRTAFAEYNLSRKYKTLTFDIGLGDTNKSGESAVFEVTVDGVSKSKTKLSFGQTAHVSVSVNNALRVRFSTSVLPGNSSEYDILAWMNPVVTS